PDKVKNTWLKLWILLGLILVLIGTGSLGKWTFLPIALCLAYWGWLELLQCIQIKYGKILSSTLITWLGTLGILGGLLGTTGTTFLGVVIAAWVAIALPMLHHRQPASMYSVLGTAFGMIFITMPLANLLELVTNSYGEFSFLVLLVMGNDGFSQGFGLMGGKTPLMPNISPAKTWVGTGGRVSVLFGYWLSSAFSRSRLASLANYPSCWVSFSSCTLWGFDCFFSQARSRSEGFWYSSRRDRGNSRQI
ncbi:MAG: phosphatidate cytidylyltransferase, partial [Pseudanabaena sp. RU_4_16]|nr:phosphatidate cytidylyltransferase [Pseudanabaena sp. RU_4_16]